MTVYEASSSAVLLVDPYNDFLAQGGKLWPRVKAVAEEVRLLDHPACNGSIVTTRLARPTYPRARSRAGPRACWWRATGL